MSALDKNTNLKLPLHTVASFSALVGPHIKAYFCVKKKLVQGISLHASQPACLPAECMYEWYLPAVHT